MQEIELKFLIHQSRLKGLMRQVKVKASETLQMSAHYYDTPKQDLAHKGIGLRIRQEGDQWVQTIKAGGDGMAMRLEHNAILDQEQVQAMLDADTLMPDLSIYKETSIADALADFKLKKLQKKLTRQYITDMQRTTRLLEEELDANSNDKKSHPNSIIELAFDEGDIIHGTEANQRHSMQELEFELVAGDVAFLFATAKVWCKRYKLCLSTVTKAERGGLLINEQDYSAAVQANLKLLQVNPDGSMPAFIRSVVHNCLLQILPNSSAIVAGSVDSEHVKQLSIGIQRLRTALSALNDFSDALNPEWLVILNQTEKLLADHNQLAHLANYIEPKLQQYGAPIVDWQKNLEKIKVPPINAVRANDFQLTLLELIAFTMSDASTDSQADKLATDKLAKVLSKAYTKLLKAEQDVADQDSVAFHASESKTNESDISEENADLDNSESGKDNKYQTLDTLLKQTESMRYLSEFAAPLYSKKKSKKWLKRVRKAQKALRRYLQHSTYQQYYQEQSQTDTNALYGSGWFAAHLKTDFKRTHKRIKKLRSSATFW